MQACDHNHIARFKCLDFLTGLGIGLATVERLTSEGAAVAIFDVNQDAGEKVVSEFRSKQLKVTFHNVDVSEKDQCTAGVKAATESNSNKLHYLVNCAAYFGCKGLEATRKDWERSLSVNVIGYANMVQACHPYLKETPGDKSIVKHGQFSGVHWTAWSMDLLSH